MILANFAVFEGIDGTGTTTQLNLLRDRFNARYGDRESPAVFTCEPTGGEIGKLIRRALRGELVYTPETMARLFAADRGEHIYGIDGIERLVTSGKAVFSDRYLFSGLAYQSDAGNRELSMRLNGDFPLPEYLFYFDIDPDIAMDRVEKRAGTLEIYEKRDFQRQVRERYLRIIGDYERLEPEMTVIRIDACKPIEEISDTIWRIASNMPKIKA